VLFAAVMVTSTGTTCLQSVLPAIGRELKVADWLVALSFSISALIWVFSAIFWAGRLRRRGARRMMIVGLAGYSLSLAGCGLSLLAGLAGWISGTAAFTAFIIARSLYGMLGSATPPAAQAVVVAASDAEDRTTALAMLASAFGLGTVIGPAVAPFLMLPGAGLASPALIFAVVGVAAMVMVGLGLEDIHHPAHPAEAEAEAGGATAGETDGEPDEDPAVPLAEPRTLPWMLVGVISGHSQVIVGQTLAFLVIDRLALPPATAQSSIGLVLMMGAAASLFAQWGLIPRLRPDPAALVRWGSLVAALGCLGTALAHELTTMAIAFATATLGFGLIRPGYAAGASLAVDEHEQEIVAGRVASVNGMMFVLGPTLGILLYGYWHPLPFLVAGLAMLGLLWFGQRLEPA
jgi:MFS family permease